MKKIFIPLLLTLLFSGLCYSLELDSGYVVRIKDNPIESITEFSLFGDASLMSEMDDSEVVAMLASELDEVHEINSDHMLVKVESEEALDDLVSLGIVEYYEPNYEYELFGYEPANNPDYSKQWHHKYINSEFAWDAGIYGNEVVVGVIDSGVYPHSDLAGNLLPGRNYNTDAINYDPYNTTDSYGHGTFVAGMIAAECNNLDVVGLSFNVKIVPIKVTDGENFYLSELADGVYACVDDFSCDVINLSLGGSSPSTTLKDAIDYAINKGVIVVAASGNNALKTDKNGNLNPPQYPAYYDEVISVANAAENGGNLRISSQSTYNEKVDVAAPGSSVYSLNKYESGGRTDSGTSFSAPLVSAAAALVKSVNSSVGQSEFNNLVKSTANNSYIASSGQTSEHWGSGLLDVKAMLMKFFGNREYFRSDIHTVGDDTYFAVTNTSKVDYPRFTVCISENIQGSTAVKKEFVSFSLDSGKSNEISLTKYGFTDKAEIRIFPDHKPGDVNGDGLVDVTDATTILQYMANYNVSYVEAAMDVNGDGSVDVTDATTILQYIAKYNVTLH